jgi:hypothetical protein
MATRARNRKQRVARVYVNGKRADDFHAMSDRIGRVVKASEDVPRKALASTRRRAVSFANRLVRESYNVRARDLSGRITTESTRTSLTVYAWRRKLPLINFGGRWGGPSSPGATVEVVRGQRVTLAGAFIRPSRARGEAQAGNVIYKRVGVREVQKFGRYKGRVRESIAQLWGPSVHNMINGRIPNPIVRGHEASLQAPGLREGPYLRGELTEQIADFHARETRRLLDVELKRGQ